MIVYTLLADVGDAPVPGCRVLCHTRFQPCCSATATEATLLRPSRVAITLDIYSHVSLELEKKAAAKLNTAFTGRDNGGLQ
jgi:hypothetical protein